MRVLGIETSCDETGVAVVEDGRILSNLIASQIDLARQQIRQDAAVLDHRDARLVARCFDAEDPHTASSGFTESGTSCISSRSFDRKSGSRIPSSHMMSASSLISW